MTRTALFDAIRDFAPDRRFNPSHVKIIDDLADLFGIPRGGEGVIPDDYWPALARIESGNRPYIKAPTSSGSGLYQFIKSTWIGEGGKWGDDPKQAFGGLKPSVEEQTARARTFTQRNVDILTKRGVPINKATLYAAHFLGAGTAAMILSKPETADAGMLAGPAATAANPTILRGKTVGDFRAWLTRKTGDTV